MLLLQPLFLLLSPVGGTTAVLPRTQTSEVSHSSPSATPLPRLPHLRVVPVWVRSARCGQRGQETTSIGRVLYVERLTAGSTAAARKCLLITCKIIIPLPDSRDPPDGPPFSRKKRFPPDCWDPPDGPPYFAKKTFPPAVSSDPPEVPPYYAQKMNTPPASWDPPCWEADLWAY